MDIRNNKVFVKYIFAFSIKYGNRDDLKQERKNFNFQKKEYK